MLHRERTKCETKVGQLVSKVTILSHFNQEPYINTCFAVHNSPEADPVDLRLYHSKIIIVTLVKVSKLGGELEEEKQLNKSLRENQEEWQVPQKKSFIIKLVAFFSDF